MLGRQHPDSKRILGYISAKKVHVTIRHLHRLRRHVSVSQFTYAPKPVIFVIM